MKVFNLKWVFKLFGFLCEISLSLSKFICFQLFLFAFDDPPSLFELLLLTWKKTPWWTIAKPNSLSFFFVMFHSSFNLSCRAFVIKAFRRCSFPCRSSWQSWFDFRFARIPRNDLWRFDVSYWVWIRQKFQEFLITAVSASFFCLHDIIPELWFIDDDCSQVPPLWYRVLNCNAITFSEPSDIFDLLHLATVTLHGFLTS